MKSINFELSCDEEPCDLLEVHYQRGEWVMLKIKWLAGSSNESKSQKDTVRNASGEMPNMDASVDPCEYNPEEKRAAYDHEVHASAVWIIGANGQWRLCDSCAALPEFKRFRKRKRI